MHFNRVACAFPGGTLRRLPVNFSPASICRSSRYVSAAKKPLRLPIDLLSRGAGATPGQCLREPRPERRIDCPMLLIPAAERAAGPAWAHARGIETAHGPSKGGVRPVNTRHSKVSRVGKKRFLGLSMCSLKDCGGRAPAANPLKRNSSGFEWFSNREIGRDNGFYSTLYPQIIHSVDNEVSYVSHHGPALRLSGAS